MRRLLERWPGGWQDRGRHLVLWHGGSWMLTWHAPWCRSCDVPSAGRSFRWERGYVAGLGFELSHSLEDRTAERG
jgi:hypothetical protein